MRFLHKASLTTPLPRRDALEGTCLIIKYISRVAAGHSKHSKQAAERLHPPSTHNTTANGKGAAAHTPIGAAAPAPAGTHCSTSNAAEQDQEAQLLSTEVAAYLYGVSPLEACQVDQWLDFVGASFISGPSFEQAAAAASDALALRTHMVGHQLTIADIGAWGALQACPMWGKVRKLCFKRCARARRPRSC